MDKIWREKDKNINYNNIGMLKNNLKTQEKNYIPNQVNNNNNNNNHNTNNNYIKQLHFSNNNLIEKPFSKRSHPTILILEEEEIKIFIQIII